jgi:hypothetical protein
MAAKRLPAWHARIVNPLDLGMSERKPGFDVAAG